MSNEIEHDKPDTITRLRAEVERLKVENEAVLSANRDVMLHWDVLKADYDRLRAAGSALIADVRRRYPGEELRCQFMRALDAALEEKP